jgi:acylglycerol lipase
VDPRCYHGNLRISTGLSLLRGFTSLLPSAARLNVPLRVVHGSNDRATDHSRSIEFVKAVQDAGRAYGHDPDASCEIYQGYEHVMLKVGSDAADDEKRQRVLRDSESWFAARV